MRIYFNDDSIKDSSLAGTEVIIGFSNTLGLAKRIFGKFSLHGKADNLHSGVYNGKSLFDTVRLCPDREAKGLVLNAFSSLFQLQDDEVLTDFKTVISLHTSPLFREHEVTIGSVLFNNIPCLESGDINVRLKRVSFFEQYKEYNYQINEPIPSNFSQLFYSEKFHGEFLDFIKCNPAAARAVITDVSSRIADFCGFNKSSELCRRNSGRLIFAKGSSGYILSTDFFHGTFEVLNLDGKHLKEINFMGVETDTRDPSRRHNINI